MVFADSYFDRHMLSTANNEYAEGLNDENQWEENIVDSQIPLDDEESDYFETVASARASAREYYNEMGYDMSRGDRWE